jgi:hypothetical protein
MKKKLPVVAKKQRLPEWQMVRLIRSSCQNQTNRVLIIVGIQFTCLLPATFNIGVGYRSQLIGCMLVHVFLHQQENFFDMAVAVADNPGTHEP